MTKLIKRITVWIETGDLIPLLVFISIPHYAQVLSKYDFWLVASIIGLLADIGQYRVTKSALRGNGWGWMIAMTLLSYAFHVAFYTLSGAGVWAFVIGLVVPILILALATLTKRENLDRKLARGMETHVEAPKAEKPQEVKAVSPFPHYSDFEVHMLSSNGTAPKTAMEVVKLGVPRSTSFLWYNRFIESHPEWVKEHLNNA